MKKEHKSLENNLLHVILQSKSIFFIAVFFLNFSSIYAQKHKFYIPDSLKNKSYKELYKPQLTHPKDTFLIKTYANAYLNKAKNEKDTVKIANGYSQLISLSAKNSNHKTTLNYCDSIIHLTKNNEDYTYPSYGYMVKGIVFYTLGNYKNSLDNYLIAEKLAKKNNNIKQTYYIQSGIGQLKMFWGNYNESKNILKKNRALLNSHKDKFENFKFLHYNNIMTLSNSYCLIKKPDSAIIYVNNAIKEISANKDSHYYYAFISQLGTVQYYQGKYKKAIKNLDISLPYIKNANELLNIYYYKALCYENLSKNKLAFSNFKKADSIYNISKDVTPEIRDIQFNILNHYKKQKDVENQLKYIDRLLYVDSIIDYNKKYISETLSKKYDRPALLLEKEKIIETLNKNNKTSSLFIFGLSFLVVVLFAFIINYYVKQKQYKKRFKKLALELKEANKPIIHTESKPTKIQGISIEIINQILKGLNDFEQNNEFIDNEINLNILAKKLNTNSNYLSKIINFYKKKNFSSYLSDLRIDYGIKKLTSDHTFRKYAIKAIASEIGFNNAESFSKAFYSKTGIYPSYFIKEIEKQD
ncbi:MAG: helix-turn-helix domain-containing protein [Lutibacter sp.]|uniref:helix-turn-helix domain-containing protein n=1 Tax=Lutibacter sp. TaxID=1925666 RepID=UPI00299D041A|nr:helix-turn-helix domain-containing protein [Lutibacter sp.]MDX1830034.1 helix-turn-helix domain-containing protein [Lutibacter sp.]